MASPTVKVLDIIGRENMRDSVFVQQLMAEGELKARRTDIIRVLRSRFEIAQTSELTAALGSIVDPERLDALFGLALECTGLDEFRKSID